VLPRRSLEQAMFFQRRQCAFVITRPLRYLLRRPGAKVLSTIVISSIISSSIDALHRA
jgi:hypothetical protein